MSDFDLVIAEAPAHDDGYEPRCWKCERKFDAMAAAWCDCDAKLRTLKCPSCKSCFCKAPFEYRQKFWMAAPKTIREDNRRFRLTDANMPSPVVIAARETPVEVGRRPHILIVDDEEPVRSLAACYVEQLGYRVTSVSSPEEALTAVDETSFDAVLTDALMPKMDGRELCRRLKEKHGDRMKVVLMTSLYKSRQFRTEARHVFKVDEYLAKPLRYDELRTALQKVAPTRQ